MAVLLAGRDAVPWRERRTGYPLTERPCEARRFAGWFEIIRGWITMPKDFYADLAADYDRMIRWERRLQVERPQFEALIERFGIRSVLDASCGSGHHLVLLASMGMEVEGSDASAAMVELARETTRKAGLDLSEKIRCIFWSNLPGDLPCTFDAVLCIGNSLPYVMNPKHMAESVRGLWSRVGPGGVLVIQYKNFEKLIAARERFLPLSWMHEPHESVAIRMYDYLPDHIDFNVLLLDRTDGEWTLRHHATQLMPYSPPEVVEVLERAGASTSLHGSLGLDPFDPAESDDVVILAAQAGKER